MRSFTEVDPIEVYNILKVNKHIGKYVDWKYAAFIHKVEPVDFDAELRGLSDVNHEDFEFLDDKGGLFKWNGSVFILGSNKEIGRKAFPNTGIEVFTDNENDFVHFPKTRTFTMEEIVTGEKEDGDDKFYIIIRTVPFILDTLPTGKTVIRMDTYLKMLTFQVPGTVLIDLYNYSGMMP